MGFNKALLPINGRALIMRVLDQVQLLTDEILLSANDSSAYVCLGLPMVGDVFKSQGPLAGLHAAMLQSTRSLFLLLACDMPNLRESLLRTLISSAAGFDAAVPRTADGRCHPLCAVYRRTCLPTVERNLEWKVNRVTDIFIGSLLRVRWLDEAEGGFCEADLANLNSPQDLRVYNLDR